MRFIHEDLFGEQREAISKAKYLSVMTDRSTKDLEAVYVRYLVNGRPVNTFIGIEELLHVHAEGHMEAIERGFHFFLFLLL